MHIPLIGVKTYCTLLKYLNLTADSCEPPVEDMIDQ